MSDFSNRILKGYELREQVGAGGFGAVYRAYQPVVGRDVAIKVILPQFASQADFIRRFETEAQLIARLQHPHIVPMHDYWRDPDGAFLVMRWLPDNLRLSISRGPWSPESALRLLDQIAGALTVAHREGIIHRDIKPDNILLDEDENAYLADFGIAKDLNMTTITVPDEETGLIGSPAYITPEQVKNEPVTPRSDIYSLGLVIYELLINEKPYQNARTFQDLISRQLSVPIPPLNERRPSLPSALNEVLQTATAKNPDQRYASVLRFAAAFRDALPTLSHAPSQPLVDPLTERELDILRLIIDGLGNEEIAQKLSLTLSTVKWYVNQIYTKLDVHSRGQTIERAQQLNLLRASHEQPTSHHVQDFMEADTLQVELEINAPMINPYKGLRAFQESDAADFFGRAALTDELLTRLSEEGVASRFLVVVGPSGSGKSSVVRAGLIPALRENALPHSGQWFVTDMLPGTHPMEELEAALMRVAVNPISGLTKQLTENRLGLVDAAQQILPSDKEVELVLIIDQFEELFTLTGDETIRAQFIDNLLAAVNDPRGRIRIILTLRADFYDKPLLYPRLAEMVRSHTEVVVPLTPQELEMAILGPAERVGLTLESGLVATILKDVGEQPGTLPLLQYALAELYERRTNNTLTLEAYHLSGGISGALARRADALYEELDEAGQQAARQLFLRLITLGESSDDTRRRTLQSELASAVGGERALEDVIAGYSQYRLLTFDRDPVTRGPTVEIAHESLIHQWGRLHDWLNDSRESLQVQRRLMTASAEWLAAGRDPSYLATGTRLADFEALSESGDLALNEDETAYLKISVEQRQAHQREADARRERELTLARQAADSAQQAATQAQQAAKSQRSAANRLRYLVAALGVFLIIAAILTVFSFDSRNSAISSAATATNAQGQALNSEATIAADFKKSEALRLAAYANGQIPGVENNAELAALLTIRSLNQEYTSQGDSALQQASSLLYTKRVIPLGDNGELYSIAFSPDGKLFASAGADKAVRLWDVETGKKIREFIGHEAPVNSVAFSPDGQYLASGSNDNTTRIWEVGTGKQVQVFTNAKANGIIHVAFSPDGKTVYSGEGDAYILGWDVASGNQNIFQRIDTVSGYFGLSPDGAYLVTDAAAGGDNPASFSLRLFSLATPIRPVRLFVGHTDVIESMQFSANGKYLLTASHDSTIRLWDVATGQELRRYLGHIGPVRTAIFTPDSHYILSGGLDHTARIFETQTGQEVRRLTGHTFSVFAATFLPDGVSALTGSYDNSVRVWNAFGPAPRHFVGHTQRILFGDISSDGNSLVTSSDIAPQAPLVWNLHTGKLTGILNKGHAGPVAFSPDGTKIANGVYGGDTALLLDAKTGNVIRQFPGHQYGVFAVSFSPDGQFLATADYTKVYIWNLDSGENVQTLVTDGTSGLVIMKYSPNGKQIVTSAVNGTIDLWDVGTGKQIHEVKIPNAGWLPVAFTPDGGQILIGKFDSWKFWDVQTGTIDREFDHATISSVLAVSFSPDGKYFLSGAYNGIAILWDTQTGQQIRSFARTGSIYVALFTPDGKAIVLAGSDREATLWDMDYHTLVGFVCGQVQRDFTDAERAQFGILDSNPTCAKAP